MGKSKVYFTDMRTSVKENLFGKLTRLMDSAGIDQVVTKRALVAIKLHFGEKGNTAYIRPIFLRKIVDKVKELGGNPFLTDCNTLYAGTRGESVSHLITAIENGFAYPVVNAPLIIADGLRGASYAEVEIEAPHIHRAFIGKDIVEADVLLSVAHFKGHELAGFGGTIKNVGMGCAARRGKLEQHSDMSPVVKKKKCVACGQCVEHCSQGAISIVENKARIDDQRCIGCGECILICPNKAIDIRWSKDVEIFQKKMVEYTMAVLKGKEKRCLFLNFLANISPACDCYGHSDAPIVNDIGIMASRDPVAIDQASVDLVNSQQGTQGSSMAKCGEGEDKFKALCPKGDWSVQLEYAQQLGLGSREYELVKI